MEAMEGMNNGGPNEIGGEREQPEPYAAFSVDATALDERTEAIIVVAPNNFAEVVTTGGIKVSDFKDPAQMLIKTRLNSTMDWCIDELQDAGNFSLSGKEYQMMRVTY